VRVLTFLLVLALTTGSASAAGQSNTGSARQRPRIRFGPGVCGPIDPSYVSVANETGGTVFPLATDEIAKSSQRMMSAFYDDLILWAYGEGERTYPIPVDSTVTGVVISASFDTKGGALTLVSPSGVPLNGGPGVTDTVFNCGRVITIEAPLAGPWQLRVVPTGHFWLTVEAKSELSLFNAQFVRPGGRPGHEGLFQIEGQPLAGTPATFVVRVDGELTAPVFELVAVDAQVLQTVDLEPTPDGEYVGTFVPPSRRFRLLVRGNDGSGLPFQRMRKGMFRGETIEVVPPVAPPVRPGATTSVTFTVRNYGPPVRLRMTASGDKGTLLPVQPPFMQLEQNGQGAAAVPVLVPDDAAPESLIEVFFTATAEGESPAGNYATAQIVVRR
jgi:hypothetical protein